MLERPWGWPFAVAAARTIQLSSRHDRLWTHSAAIRSGINSNKLSHSHFGLCGPASNRAYRIGNRTRGSPVFACVIGAARRDD